MILYLNIVCQPFLFNSSRAFNYFRILNTNAVNYIRNAEPALTIGKDGTYKDMASYIMAYESGSHGLAYCAEVNMESHFRSFSIRSRLELAKHGVFSASQIDEAFFEIMTVAEYQKDAKTDLSRIIHSTNIAFGMAPQQDGEILEYVPEQVDVADSILSQKRWILGGFLNYIEKTI